MEKTVVGLFDNLDVAQDAVQELLDNGFHRNDISVVRTNQQGDYTSGNMAEGSAGDASGAAAGAGIGAVLGGLAGLLVGLGALAIPGIGPIIAAGPLATALAGAGLGAATGGLVGALADAGIPEDEAGNYAEGVRRGGTLVTVRAQEDQVDRATEILNRHAPVDINQRTSQWQSSGWSGYDANAGPYSTTGAQGASMGMAAGGAAGAGMGSDAAASSESPNAAGANDMEGSHEGPGQGYSAGAGSDSGSDYRAQTGYTGENSGGTYEGTGSAGYTGSGTTYRGEGSFTSNTGDSQRREGYTDTGATYGGGDTYTSDMDKPKGSDMTESPDRVGSSKWSDEDSVMRSGHGEMSTSTGFSGQGGGTYERMQDADSTVHPRSAEGDYQARRDFLGGDQSQGENQSATSGMIETGHGSYGSQGQGYQAGESDPRTSKGEAWEDTRASESTGGTSGTATGGDMGTTGVTFRSGPSRSRFNQRFEDFDPDFRSDWEQNYRSTGYGYERFQPAYQYGWQLGEQNQDRDWNDFEASARTDWERSHPDDAWQDFRSAVRQGWDRFKSGVGSQGQEQPYKGIEQGSQDRGMGASQGGQDAGRSVQDFSQASRDQLSSFDRTVGDMSRGFDTYDQDFRRNWETSYRSTGYGYERFQPAYQYGYNLASDNRYRSRQWDEIEGDARRDWEMRHPNDSWNDFKGAIQHAWNRVRSGMQDALD